MHHLKTILVVLVMTVLLFFVRPAFGKAVFGNITGTVSDPSGNSARRDNKKLMFHGCVLSYCSLSARKG